MRHKGGERRGEPEGRGREDVAPGTAGEEDEGKLLSNWLRTEREEGGGGGGEKRSSSKRSRAEVLMIGYDTGWLVLVFV